MKSTADNPEKIKGLKKSAISDNDIEDTKEFGLVPEDWQAHHKIPLDQGGSNDVENLVLIKTIPITRLLQMNKIH
ncbi:HNH endonuclease [Bacillus pseudomycoides]|uniref:HNH endonuclease n=1 Tax=Bacillus pseudomycoides TaxID=64104 RepID=UPI002E22BAB7|nr:HNH endonuclease [Bacillus pseudomycoides]